MYLPIIHFCIQVFACCVNKIGPLLVLEITLNPNYIIYLSYFSLSYNKAFLFLFFFFFGSLLFFKVAISGELHVKWGSI